MARAMHLFATTTADQELELGKVAAFVEVDKPASESPAPTRIGEMNSRRR
jgi:hypothetical protein